MAFSESVIEDIRVDSANPNYFVSGPFLIGGQGATLIRYFGFAANLIIGHMTELHLTEIGRCAFAYCSTLMSICIPAGIEILGEQCFMACSSLSELTFESGSRLTRIGDLAFIGCSSLESICIPAQVEHISFGCFKFCDSLAEVTFEPGSKLVEICNEAFSHCFSLCSILFPGRVEFVRFGALEGCASLEELAFETLSLVKQLDLPPSDFGSLYIPDSVEVVTGITEELEGQRRRLRFGRESHLRELDMRKTKPICVMGRIRTCSGNDVFVCLSEEILRRFRFKFEGV
jgi:hypothetical protein